MTPSDQGGVLEDFSHLVVYSANPLEAWRRSGDAIVTNTVDFGITYTFFMPATVASFELELQTVAKLVKSIVEALLKRVSAPDPQSQLGDHPAVQAVIKRLRIVLLPFPIFDTVYVLNATNPDLAKVFHYLNHDRRAVQLKEREAARFHADQLLALRPSGPPAVIQLATGSTARTSIESHLHEELTQWLGGPYAPLLEFFLPGLRQKVLPFRDTVARSTPR